MRKQFFDALDLICQERSSSNPNIKWWFSEVRTAGARRVGMYSFSTEHTKPS